MQDLLTAIALVVVFGMATVFTETFVCIIKSLKK